MGNDIREMTTSTSCSSGKKTRVGTDLEGHQIAKILWRPMGADTSATTDSNDCCKEKWGDDVHKNNEHQLCPQTCCFIDKN